MPQITLIFVILFGITLSAHGATVYRYTDENGNTVFTDEPVEGAKKLDVKPIATVPAIPVPQPTPAPPKEEPFKYTSIKITNPSNEQFARPKSKKAPKTGGFFCVERVKWF